MPRRQPDTEVAQDPEDCSVAGWHTGRHIGLCGRLGVVDVARRLAPAEPPGGCSGLAACTVVLCFSVFSILDGLQQLAQSHRSCACQQLDLLLRTRLVLRVQLEKVKAAAKLNTTLMPCTMHGMLAKHDARRCPQHVVLVKQLGCQ